MEILRNPRTGNPLRLIVDSDENGELVDDQSGDKFMIREGIPVFVSENELSGFNKKYQGLYNRIAPFYDISTSLFALFKSGGEKKRRLEYLNELEIKDGDKVLEISVGTGANLRFLPSGADYYGVDITWGMLKQCRKKIKKNNLKVELFQCAAEAVCFKDEAFDVVFHVGGINFFNDKERAILEMIRLAKPGTKMIIVDETEELARKYEKRPFSARFYGHRPETITVPQKLLPSTVEDVRSKIIANGELYCLSFRKPR